MKASQAQLLLQSAAGAPKLFESSCSFLTALAQRVAEISDVLEAAVPLRIASFKGVYLHAPGK
jgi:hypothetical protein